jgi:DNA replication protein DnaC
MSITLDLRLQEALSSRLDYADFLELILQDELNIRNDRLLRKRVKSASFHKLKPLDQFNWDFNSGIERRRIFDLSSCEFIRQAKDVLFIGPPGVGNYRKYLVMERKLAFSPLRSASQELFSFHNILFTEVL